MDWSKHFTKERHVRALVRRAGVARPRIKTLTAQLMRPHRSSEPGLLVSAATPQNVRATLAALAVLEARLEYDTSAVSPRGQRIAPDDLARLKDALR